MPFPRVPSTYINRYNNISSVYKNNRWKYYSPYQANVLVLFNSKTSVPFFYKGGKRQKFKKRANGLYYSNSSRLMNVPTNLKQVAQKYQQIGAFKPRTKVHTLLAYKQRATKKTAGAKVNATQKKRVNRLVANAAAGLNISKAKTDNLVRLIMRYQNENSDPYYTLKNGKVKNNSGRPPARKRLLSELKFYRNEKLGPYNV